MTASQRALGGAGEISSKPSLLILDDEVSVLDLLAQHLREEGYVCQTASAPYDALEILARGGIDLLLTDLKMPQMHGIEVVRRSRAISESVSIIVITAMLDVVNAVDAMRAGADDYLVKPFNLAEISLAIEGALEKRRLMMLARRHQDELRLRVHEATADLELANRELRATKEYLEALLDSTVDAIVTVGADEHISYVNEGALAMFGYKREDMVGQHVSQYFIGGAQEVAYLARLLEQQESQIKNYETEMRNSGGTFIPVNMSLSLVEKSDGGMRSAFAIIKDITEQKRLERELKEMSIKDSLTGLFNQRYFYDRIESEIERARRQGHPLSLLLFDIDQFKQYNDCHGHLEGDRVLAEVGRVVQESTREHVDIGFRYGGDEFTVILPEANQEEALLIAERIRTTFAARRFDKLTLSIGLMTYRQGSSMRSFIRFADARMYDAKRSGGNQVFIYDPQDRQAAEPTIPASEI